MSIPTNRQAHLLTLVTAIALCNSAARAQNVSTAAPPGALNAAPSAAPAAPVPSVSAAGDAGNVPPPATANAASDLAQSPTAPAPGSGTTGLAQLPTAPAAAAGTTPPAASPATATEQGAQKSEPDRKKKKKLRAKQPKKAKRAADKPGVDESEVLWGDPWGDSQDELRAAGLSFKFLVQTHYRQTFAFKSSNSDPDYHIPEETLVRSRDGWGLNRLFFRIAAEPSKYVGLKIITDFAEFAHNNGKQALKQAFVDLRPIPKHIHFLAGVLKLPFSITELDPIAAYEFTRMGEANDLIKGLGFAGRDMGAEIMVTPLAKPRYLTLALGAFRGHAAEEQGALFGEVGARAATEPLKGLRFGVDWAVMPKTVTYLSPFDTAHKDLLPNPENPNFPRSRTWDKGQAASADVTFHRYGVMLRTEGMIGTRVDHDTLYQAKRFGAVWGVAAYRFPLTGSLSLQPALRLELLDTDLDYNNGLRTQLAAGFATYFTKSVRALLDVERTIVQDNSPTIEQPLPLRAIPYGALSNTCITGQVQVVM
jgi:hypothetical protein